MHSSLQLRISNFWIFINVLRYPPFQLRPPSMEEATTILEAFVEKASIGHAWTDVAMKIGVLKMQKVWSTLRKHPICIQALIRFAALMINPRLQVHAGDIDPRLWSSSPYSRDSQLQTLKNFMRVNSSRARKPAAEPQPEPSAEGDESSGEPDCSGDFWGDEDEKATTNEEGSMWKPGEGSESENERDEDPCAGPEDVPPPSGDVSSSSEEDARSEATGVRLSNNF